jgi:O-acetyl-ADP-ribose deacetylase (regulator of RNase III)
MRITLQRGDIVTLAVDAIVNAANPTLLGGGGVDGAIHGRGGPEILEACREIRRDRYPDGLPVGDAVATTAGALPARWVIHTVGPHFTGKQLEQDALASCYVRSLAVADEMGARSVAFPAISCGAFGYPPDLAAPTALSAVMHATTSVADVIFVLWSDDMLEIFRSAMNAEVQRHRWGIDELGRYLSPIQ